MATPTTVHQTPLTERLPPKTSTIPATTTPRRRTPDACSRPQPRPAGWRPTPVDGSARCRARRRWRPTQRTARAAWARSQRGQRAGPTSQSTRGDDDGDQQDPFEAGLQEADDGVEDRPGHCRRHAGGGMAEEEARARGPARPRSSDGQQGDPDGDAQQGLAAVDGHDEGERRWSPRRAAGRPIRGRTATLKKLRALEIWRLDASSSVTVWAWASCARSVVEEGDATGVELVDGLCQHRRQVDQHPVRPLPGDGLAGQDVDDGGVGLPVELVPEVVEPGADRSRSVSCRWTKLCSVSVSGAAMKSAFFGRALVELLLHVQLLEQAGRWRPWPRSR